MQKPNLLSFLYVLSWTAVLASSEDDVAAWGVDDACGAGDDEACALSFRQLRGIKSSISSEPFNEEKAKEEKAKQEKARKEKAEKETKLFAVPPAQDEVTSIKGVPLYRHRASNNLGAGPQPPPPGKQRWLVAMKEETAAQKPWLLVQGDRQDLEAVLDKHEGKVSFVEEDGFLYAIPGLWPDTEQEHGSNGTGNETRNETPAPPWGTKLNPPASWGLDRIDARDGVDHYYEAAEYGGTGTHVYMLDTGILTSHADFGGRAVPTIEVDDDGVHECSAANMSCAQDRDGHGSHTAATVGGRLFGVAKNVTLHACKVLSDDGGGRLTWTLQALDWIVEHGQRPAVVSASLGGRGNSPGVAAAVERAFDRGVTVVVAAGNEREDACGFIPAQVPAAITVGAIELGDKRASYSNYGSCLDIFAPGTDITSAAISSNTAKKRLSGTSMACPHVAGAAALLLAEDPSRTPANVTDILLRAASADRVGDPNGSPNRLLYTQPSHPRPPNNISGFEIYEGPCEVDEGCINSPGYPLENYGNNELCTILVHGDVGFVCFKHFDTESGFDYLTINGRAYSGEKGKLCLKPEGVISWSSDLSETRSGWQLCAGAKPPSNATPGFWVVDGSCPIDGEGCVTSPNYPHNYFNGDRCLIDINNISHVSVVDFDTESYDVLTIGNESLHGYQRFPGTLPAAQIEWSSDSSVSRKGWKLCPGKLPCPP